MLVQGITIARAGRVLISKQDFVLMAIYVSAELDAVRYFLHVNPQNENVRFYQHQSK